MTELDDLLGFETDEATAPRVVLTPAREAFAVEFFDTGNATMAYRNNIRSEGNIPTLRHLAMRMKNNPKVQARLQELREDLSKNVIISKVQVLNELAKVAMFDVRNLYDGNGDLIPLHLLDDVTAASIVGIEANRLRTPTEDNPEATQLITAKVKLADKRAALVDIGKHLGMFTDKVEMTGAEGKDLIPEASSAHDLARRVAFLLTSGVRE